MLHVFAETNWVVDYVAPGHHQSVSAVSLHERAKDGELVLHVPAISLAEARKVIMNSQRFRPREPADAMRDYLAFAVAKGEIVRETADQVRRVVEGMERRLQAELRELDPRLSALKEDPAIDLFALSDAMLQRSIHLSAELTLESFDMAILGAVLVRAEALRAEDEHVELGMCVLDADLQPWTKRNDRKEPLCRLFDDAHVWVYGDFDLETRLGNGVPSGVKVV